MEKENLIFSILTLILPLLGGGIGYFLKQSIDKKKELQSEVAKERRQHYQEFVYLIINLFHSTKTSKNINTNAEIIKLFDFYKKYILYASPEVITAFSEYFPFLYSAQGEVQKLDSSTNFRKLSRILKAMRKDLGLSNKNLGKDGEILFRAIISDFDKTIKT